MWNRPFRLSWYQVTEEYKAMMADIHPPVRTCYDYYIYCLCRIPPPFYIDLIPENKDGLWLLWPMLSVQ